MVGFLRNRVDVRIKAKRKWKLGHPPDPKKTFAPPLPDIRQGDTLPLCQFPQTARNVLPDLRAEPMKAESRAQNLIEDIDTLARHFEEGVGKGEIAEWFGWSLAEAREAMQLAYERDQLAGMLSREGELWKVWRPGALPPMSKIQCRIWARICSRLQDDEWHRLEVVHIAKDLSLPVSIIRSTIRFFEEWRLIARKKAPDNEAAFKLIYEIRR